MDTKYTLSDVFNHSGLRTAPLPESTDSAALSRDQLQTLIHRFAAEDAAVFNFLQFYKSRSDDKEPVFSREQAELGFRLYLENKYRKCEIKLSDEACLLVKSSEMRGLKKTSELADYVRIAFHCRTVLQQKQNPADSEFIEILKRLSTQIEKFSTDYWGLSAQEAQLIKNITLPANAFDPALVDKDTLMGMYNRHLQKKTAIRPDNQRKSADDTPIISIVRFKAL